MPMIAVQKRRAALLLGGAMLIAAPALAQDAAAPTSVPQSAAPVVIAPPAPVEPAATAPSGVDANAPAGQSAPPASTASGPDAVPVNPEAAAAAEADEAERAADRRAAAALPVSRAERAAKKPPIARQQTADTASAAKPAAPAPVVRPAPAAPAAVTAASSAATDGTSSTQAEPAAPTPPVTQSSETTSQTSEVPSSGVPLWAAVVAGVVVLAGIAALLLRRRRADEDHEPLYAEEAGTGVYAPAAYAPLATTPEHPVTDANPVTADEVTIVPADSDDVAALTTTATPADRPWIEFAMRPVRAGTNVDEALVEIELTVANAGDIAAEDVRVSTFMLSAGDDSEMERLLIEPSSEVDPLTIAPGEGARVDATLTMNRAALFGDGSNATFQPVVVADARYRLPDGSEGRTSASFLIGAAEDGRIEPIALDRVALRDDVEAQLYREPARV